MRILCLLYCVYAINCLLFESFNTSEPVWKQLEALEHVHTFLLSVQKEIKESRDLLNHLNFNNVLFSTDETKLKDPLRTEGSNVTAVLTTTPTSVVPGSHNPQGSAPGAAREQIIPDLTPEYKDVFSNDNNATLPILIATATTPSSGTDVLSQVNKYVGATGPKRYVSDVGHILMGQELDDAAKEDTHPILHEQLVRDESGYFSVGVENLFMLIAKKKPQHVKEVLENAFYIVQQLDIQGGATHLRWLGEPMTDMLNNVLSSLTPEDIDVQEIQAQATILWKLMKGRRRLLSQNANRIIDFADGMVKKKEGDEMFDRLDDFKAYPKLTDLTHADFMRPVYTTGRQLCYGIIKSFVEPFVTTTVDRERLVYAANAAFREHFGNDFQRRAAQLWPKLNSWLNNDEKSQKNQVYKLENLSRKSNYLNSMSNRRTIKRLNKWTVSETPESYYLRTVAFKNNNKYNNIYRNHYNEEKNLIKSRYVFPKSPNFYARPNDDTLKNSNKITFASSYTDKKTVTPSYKNIAVKNEMKTDSKKYPSLYGRPNSIHRRANIGTVDTKFDEKINPSVNLSLNISKLEPKYPEKVNNDRMESYYEDISKSMNESVEKTVLDVKELNRLLNVTGKESFEDVKDLNISIETDDDEEVLKRVHNAFYEK